MNIYQEYAPVYDAIGQGAFAEHLACQALEQLPFSPSRVLDLACGTGAAALVFAAAGCRVVGIDRSAAMLDRTRANATQRGLDLAVLRGDIRSLAAVDDSAGLLEPHSFDLVTCFYDSLNYLRHDDDLLRVCQGVGQLLRPGGRFVFDLNTEHEFATWNETDQVVYDDDTYLVYNRLSYDFRRRRGAGRIVWFVRRGERWWRGEETHTERPWSETAIQHALEQAGLLLLARRTPTGEPADDAAPRVVYTASSED